LKPRFRLDDSNELQLIPAPLHPFTEDNYQRSINQPEQFFIDDFFRVDGPNGLSHPGFPYTLSLAGGIVRLAERYQRRGATWYAKFYAPDHPAQAVALSVRLLQAFANESQATNRRPLVIIFPTSNDLRAAGNGQNWPYQTLLRQLDATGLSYLDMGPALLEATADGDLCEYFDADCRSHFNASGSELVAGLVHAWLTTTLDPAFSIATHPN